MATTNGMMISIAKGSFDDDAMGSPQLTMSVDSTTDLPAVAPAPGEAATATDDEDEHNVEEPVVTLAPATEDQQLPRGLGPPLSSNSLLHVPTARSTDQVLELNNRLDLTDSSAILSRLNNQACPIIRDAPAASSKSRLSNRRSPTGSPSRSPSRSPSSKVSTIKSLHHRLTRRPSVHDTHDSPPLRRGEFLYYLYSFAILGTTIRVFLGRLFGLDCEFPGEIQDFLTPLSKNVCVTSSGFTIQHGGALFIDLPANMLGSFIMGLVSSLHPEGGRDKLPWLRKEHPLQRHDGLHHAIKVGLCGSLTTFSSWNSQMVAMMDGTDTELGSQVVPAIFGYIIGMACAAWAFMAGGRVHEWLYDWSNTIKNNNHHEGDVMKPPSNPSIQQDYDDGDEEQPPTSWDSEESLPRYRHAASNSNDGSTSSVMEAADQEDVSRRQSPPPTLPSRQISTSTSLSIKEILLPGNCTSITICLHKVIPFCITFSLLLAYGLTVDEHNVQFFRELCSCSLLTPIGVHLRWKLAALNGRGLGVNRRYEWLPLGTLTGNLSAVVISVIFQALYMKYSNSGNGDHPYILALMVGMKVGVAGSLSTVSSFAKETVNLATLHPTHAKAYIYSAGTITASMLLGLAIYSPSMRYG